MLTRPVPLTLRETGWGYVVRSVQPEAEIPRLWARIGWGGCAGLVLLVALSPAVGLVWKSALCLSVLAAVHVGLKLLRRTQVQELHVDMRRRELRLEMVTGSGDAWIKASLRFDEVTSSAIRRDGRRNSLWLQVKGDEALLPVALGEEAVLLKINDRVMRDIRPVARNVSSYKMATGEAGPMGPRRPFPPLVPQEVA